MCHYVNLLLPTACPPIELPIPVWAIALISLGLLMLIGILIIILVKIIFVILVR